MSEGRFDATSLKDFQKCEQYAILRHGEGLVAPIEAEGLLIGRALHAAVAEFWRGGGVAAMEVALEKDFGGAPPGLTQLLRNYEKVYFQRRSECEVLLVEEVVEHPTEPIGGVIDLVLKEADSTLVVVDHKSTSSRSQEWLQQWRHSAQLVIYKELAAQKFKHERSQVKLVVDVLKLGSAKGKIELDWQEIEYDEELVEEIWGQVREQAAKASILLQHPLAAGKDFGACIEWGRLCPFFGICTAPPRGREATKALLLGNGSLVVKPWDYTRRDK
jgi:hypothetical protein